MMAIDILPPDKGGNIIFNMPPIRIVRISLILFLIIFILQCFQYSYSARPILLGNELSHVSLLYSIVHNKTFAISPTYNNASLDLSYCNGRYYSNKPPGFPLLLVPFYYLFIINNKLEDSDLLSTFLFVKTLNMIISSLLAVTIFLLLSAYSLSLQSILFGTVAAVLGTVLPAYSCLATSAVLSVFLCVLSMLFWRISKKENYHILCLALSLFFSSYALIVDFKNLFFLFPLILLLGYNATKEKNALAGLLFLFPLGLLMYYNWQAFGKIITNSYSYYVVPSYVKWTTVSGAMKLANMPWGLWGFLFSESRGMFTISPVTLLAIISSFFFFRQKQWHLLLFAVMAFSGILFMSTYSLWHGGNSIGYRHILPGAVILAMLSAFLVERIKGMALVSILLLAWSIVTGLAAFFIQVDPDLLSKTWKFEPADLHADFYRELMVPILTKMFRLVKGG